MNNQKYINKSNKYATFIFITFIVRIIFLPVFHDMDGLDLGPE